MNGNARHKRRNIFIKKRFQTDFSIKFLILIVIESLLAIGLFTYLSKGTVITGFSGADIVIEKTGEYFLPSILLANLVIIGVTAAAGFIVMLLVSHKLAGPLYRFEKSLEETGKGDLTHRFKLRTDDQMASLAEKMNEFNARMEASVIGIQKNVRELNTLLSGAELALSPEDKQRLAALLQDARKKMADLEKSVDYFRTSENAGK